jgi:uncharacterized membrane protein
MSYEKFESINRITFDPIKTLIIQNQTLIFEVSAFCTWNNQFLYDFGRIGINVK